MCTTTGVQGDFESWTAGAPTGWEREATYEAEWRHGASTWQPTTLTVSGDDVSFTATANPDVDVDVRVGGHDRQHRRRLGAWSAWSVRGAWSNWDEPTSPTCPLPTPTAPSVPAPPVTLMCGSSQLSGTCTGWTGRAPAGWSRQHEYEAQYRCSGTAGSCNTATITNLPANQVRISGPSDPGNKIDLRTRARGRHRQRSNGVWSAWSAWGAWSSRQTDTTPTYPPPPPPTAPNWPGSPSVTCTGISGGPTDAKIAWTAVGADGPLTQCQYEVSWYWDLQDVNTSVRRAVIEIDAQ